MILIDAIYVNNSGGKILLDFLIEKLELTDLKIFYLLDNRVRNNHPKIKPNNSIHFLEGSLIQRHRFYHDHGNEFTKILCFGNFPPDYKLKAKVYTYFHQLLFIHAPKELSYFSRLLVYLKTSVLSYSACNSDLWLVQSEQVKEKLSEKFKQISKNQIHIIPFYPPVNLHLDVIRQKNKFIYASTGHLYKNHKRLLQGFTDFFNKHKVGSLHLTVGEEFVELNESIKLLQSSGYPIFNHGFVDRNTLTKIYQSSEFAIYPSLVESFGLGIIEAIESGCKIIGSDLPFLHAICVPSCVFDPKSVKSILSAIEKAVLVELKPTRPLVSNEIDQIIDLLK